MATNTGSELGRFLKARRAAVRPTDVGLPTGPGIRRTPGLRREELAALAGVSVDYYTRLERGKENRPSPAVVDALAGILRLTPDEHSHLRALARQDSRSAATRRLARPSGVRPGHLALLEALRPNPAYIANRINDMTAANPGGRALMPGLFDGPAEAPNIIRYLFLDARARQVYPEWEDLVPGSVAHLRALAGANPDDPELVRLVGELVCKSHEFARLWERYEVKVRTDGFKRFHHPDVGAMTLGYEAMGLSNTDGLRLIAYHAEPGTSDYDAMVLLDMASAASVSERYCDHSPL